MNDAQKQQFAGGARLDPVATRALIESFQPPANDVIAPKYKQDFLDLIGRAPDQFANRFNYHIGLNGHFTSQAIVWNPHLRKVALLLNKKLGVWTGPGGHVEPEDMDLIATSKREAMEELGLRDLFLMEATPFDLDLHGFPAKGDQPDHHHYDARFLFTTRQTELIVKKAEVKEARWADIGEARELMGMWLPSCRIIRGLEARFGP